MKEIAFDQMVSSCLGYLRWNSELAVGAASENTALSSVRGRKRRKVSWVWNHFQHRGDSLVCLECELSQYGRQTRFDSSAATPNLADHLKSKHKIEKDTSTTDLTQTTLSREARVQRHDVSDNEYLSKCRSDLAHLIFDAKLSFSLVEMMMLFALMYAPWITISHRWASVLWSALVKTNILKQFHWWRSACARLTCDGWYFAVTALWISEHFELKNLVLDFFVIFRPA